MTIVFNPIGIIHSPYPNPEGTPIQPGFSKGQQCRVAIFPKYRAGIADPEGFSHIHLIYFMHRAEGYALTCTPFLDTREHGIFAPCAPRRPNPTGFRWLSCWALTGAC